MNIRIKITSVLVFFSLHLLGQDVQLSQYYNAPLYLNPAFTGTINNSRAILNYRTQWTALPSPFVTYAASFDHYIAPYSSGVGIMLMRDRQGDGHLNSTSVNLLYSYHVYVSDKYTFIPALQAGWTNRSVNYADFIFGDQLGVAGPSGGASVDQVAGGPSVNFLDFAGGGLLYSDHLWLGFSAHHLNRPDQAFTGSSKLPLKASVHGGYKIFLEKQDPVAAKYKQAQREKSITPTFLYKSQAGYDQFDLGVYAMLEPVMFGFWYRGIPIKKYNEGVNNSEALVFMAGLHYMGLTLGYSYDLTISSLSPASGGAHELSLTYQWEIPYNNYKPKKRARKVSCPSFYK